MSDPRCRQPELRHTANPCIGLYLSEGETFGRILMMPGKFMSTEKTESELGTLAAQVADHVVLLFSGRFTYSVLYSAAALAARTVVEGV